MIISLSSAHQYRFLAGSQLLDKFEFSYVYLVMPGLTGHLLYNIRVYNYVTG